MTYTDFIKLVAKNTNNTQAVTKSVLDGIYLSLAEVVKAEDEVCINGAVKVSGVRKAAHVARNPQNGEAINVPEHIEVKVKAMPALKKDVR